MSSKLFVIALIYLFASLPLLADFQGQSSQTPATMELEVANNEFKVLSYNLYNLFDAEHDEGKSDWTWLPLNYPGKYIKCQELSNEYYRKECQTTNWTQEKLEMKVRQLARVVRLQGSLPDLMAVQEIENGKALGLLQKELGYERLVITNSPDRRGIDVGLMFNEDKLEYIEHEEINISDILEAEFGLNVKTRNILRVHFKPKFGNNKKVIGVYVNHWPSQSKGSIFRYNASQILRNHIDEQTNTIGSSNYYVIAMGDFNTIDADSPHPFYHVMHNPLWKNYLVDVQSHSFDVGNPMRFKMPIGTFWYKRGGIFNQLDRIFISKNLRSPESLAVVPDSFRIVGTEMNSRTWYYKDRNGNFHPTEHYIPLRSNFHTTDESRAGFSDHYPVAVKFRFP
ncbi:MAG: hypothetical protein MK008_00225 [Bdellovibrionales bacterium]|nr:hypothetical protein [Bdellovibrionales bacterium]